LARLFAADLPGVIETRARFGIEREQTDELWTPNEKSTPPRAHNTRGAADGKRDRDSG
jgi:hypothetical protein